MVAGATSRYDHPAASSPLIVPVGASLAFSVDVISTTCQAVAKSGGAPIPAPKVILPVITAVPASSCLLVPVGVGDGAAARPGAGAAGVGPVAALLVGGSAGGVSVGAVV